MQPRLMILCGLPGSGKTTLAKRMERERGLIRLCPDEWLTDLGVDLWDEALRERLEQRLTTLALTLLRHGQSVVLEYGFWGRSERDQKRTEARANGAAIDLYYLNPPPAELWQRLEQRNHTGEPGTVTISQADLASFRQMLQAPDAAEFALFDQAVEVTDALHQPL